MKSILHISKYYDPYIGGIETVAKQLVTGLDNYNNIVICFSNDKQTHYDQVDGIQVIRIGVHASIASQDIAPSYVVHLRKAIRSFKPDAIHLHCPNPFIYPAVLSLIPKQTKLVVHWHSDILGKGALYTLIAPLEKQLLQRSDMILATSPNYPSHSIALKPFQQKISILPNVITPENFILQAEDNSHIQKIKKQYANQTLLFFFGRHVPYKGIDSLISSAQWIQPNVHILIAGTGPLTEKYKSLARGNQQISFLGKLSDNELRCYLHAADLFAFPSINKAEAFGVALAEAMYCGCVPIVFHIEGSGVNWVSINGETGIEVPSGDVHAYAKAVNQLSDDNTLRQTMAKAAHQRINQLFTTTTFNMQINDLYTQLLSK